MPSICLAPKVTHRTQVRDARVRDMPQSVAAVDASTLCGGEPAHSGTVPDASSGSVVVAPSGIVGGSGRSSGAERYAGRTIAQTHQQIVQDLISRWPEHRIAPGTARVEALCDLLG